MAENSTHKRKDRRRLYMRKKKWKASEKVIKPECAWGFDFRGTLPQWRTAGVVQPTHTGDAH